MTNSYFFKKWNRLIQKAKHFFIDIFFSSFYPPFWIERLHVCSNPLWCLSVRCLWLPGRSAHFKGKWLNDLSWGDELLRSPLSVSNIQVPAVLRFGSEDGEALAGLLSPSGLDPVKAGPDGWPTQRPADRLYWDNKWEARCLQWGCFIYVFRLMLC